MAPMKDTVNALVPKPRLPADIIPILLTVHLLGLVTAIAMTVGLIPAAIALLRVMFVTS